MPTWMLTDGAYTTTSSLEHRSDERIYLIAGANAYGLCQKYAHGKNTSACIVGRNTMTFICQTTITENETYAIYPSVLIVIKNTQTE